MPDRLVLCLDGTWNNTFKQVQREDGTKVLKPTNPLKLARATLPAAPDGTRQLTYYDSGVGALGRYPGFSNTLLYGVDSLLGGAYGAGFEANVEQAANFVAMNHTEGAELFVFGFSRGAAQARALCNFLDWLGGIPAKSDAYYVPRFFRHYLDTHGKGRPGEVTSSSGDEPAKRLKPINVTFLGVWDTVMALGARLRAKSNTSVMNRAFHIQPAPAACVQHARQALAIDEKRYDFRPEIWQQSAPGQTMEQRWFPGVHANVGGSYGDDGLANAALHWIVDEAKAAGLAVDEKFLRKYNPYPMDRIYDSHGLLYKVTEALRLRRGKGARPLAGHPPGGALSLDRAAIIRFCADPAKHEEMQAPYRPKALVELLKPHAQDWPAYLAQFDLDPERAPWPSDL